MKHLQLKECEQGEGFHCQLCDKSFFHSSQEDPVCPNCGASGFKWLEPIVLQEEEEEGAKTAAQDRNIESGCGSQ